MKEGINTEGYKMLEFDGGYAVIKDGKVWIPAIVRDMGKILDALHEDTGLDTFIFSAVMNPEAFKIHLRNIISEWDEWFEEVQDYSHCIEVRYEKHL